MRRALIALLIFLGSTTSALAAVSINIGLNLGAYPSLVRVPGYPVYYAPSVNSNYFFYDGLYWVFHGDNWYESRWYNGPWVAVEPDFVPLYVLRVPVRYYRHPPAYFRGWRADYAPRWGDHWGHTWETRHTGWDRWDRKSAPAAAPLPTYQRQYSANRYPQQAEQQTTLHSQGYRYQPRDAVVQQRYQQQAQVAPAQRGHVQEQRGQAQEHGQGKGHEDRGRETSASDRAQGRQRRCDVLTLQRRGVIVA